MCTERLIGVMGEAEVGHNHIGLVGSLWAECGLVGMHESDDDDGT
jgi:hypothetical protein